MKIGLPILALGLLLSCSAPKVQEPIRTIAVVDIQVSVETAHSFAMPDHALEDYRTPLTEIVESVFLSTGRYTLVERERLYSVQKELIRSQDDVWFDQNDIAKIGKFKGARALVLPTARLKVGILATTLTLQVKVTDVETGKITHTYTASATSYNMNTNTSITNCLTSIRASLLKQISKS